MKLSTRARYALRCMIAVSKMSDSQKPVSLDKVAAQTRVSKRYLEQLVIVLKNASLLRSVAGRNGGYYLARPAKDIRVGEIIEAGIGPVNIVDCVKNPGTCMISDLCECRLIYELINKRIKEALYEYSLADMTDRKWREDIEKKLAAH